MRESDAVPPVEWRSFRAAFGAALRALEPEAPPPPSTEFLIEGVEGKDRLKFKDHPFTRVLFAVSEWFPREDQMSAAASRVIALLAAFNHLPIACVASSEQADGYDLPLEEVRDELFMVAAEIRLNRNGKMPLGRLRRLIQERIQQHGA